MRFHEIYFKNLLSFKETTIKLDQTNIIVGPNNSGKTNIFRILGLFSNHELPLSVLRLPKHMKNDSLKESIIGLDIELSKNEIIAFFQLIFHREITEEIPDSFCKLRILLKWQNLVEDESLVTYQLIRFDNSLTIFGEENLTLFATNDNDWKFLSDINFNNIHSRRRIATADGYSLEKVEYQKKILSDKKFIDLYGDGTFTNHNVQAQYKGGGTSKVISDVFDFLGVKRETGTYITIWFFLAKILQNNISIVKDTRPTIEWLADSIHSWRDTHEAEYHYLKNDFTSLFPDTTFHLHKEAKQTSILISDKGKSIPLEHSASGYFAGLYLLFTIYDEKEHTLFFDEPETHFHPTKLMLLSTKLSELASSSQNQTTIITHSPTLLDFSMLQDSSYRVIYINRQDEYSEIHQPSDEFIPEINSHHFDPQIFFERSCIIVEGPSDEYTIKAISASYNHLLRRTSIGLVNAGGKDQIEPFIKLLKEYGIPYIAMADSDYTGLADGVIKLEQDLEFEFEKLGWQRKGNEGEKKEKIRAEKAYSFLIDHLKDESQKSEFEKSSLWKVIRSVVE